MFPKLCRVSPEMIVESTSQSFKIPKILKRTRHGFHPIAFALNIEAFEGSRNVAVRGVLCEIIVTS